MKFDYLFWHDLSHDIERAYHETENRARTIVRIADSFKDKPRSEMTPRRRELLDAEYKAAKAAQSAAAIVKNLSAALRQSIVDLNRAQDTADNAIHKLQQATAATSAEIREPGSDATPYDLVTAALDLAIPFTAQNGQFSAVYTVRFVFDRLDDDDNQAITRAIFKEGRALNIASIRKPSAKNPNFAINCRMSPDMRGVDIAARIQKIIDDCRASSPATTDKGSAR